MSLPILYMGPLKGYTDYIYRNTFARHFNGFDLAVAPFVATGKGRKINRKLIVDILPENNTDMPVIPQILSRSIKAFLLLATAMYDLGYKTINWNLGCPYPMKAEKNRAAWLLPYPDLIHEFLTEITPLLKGKISIKARLGLIDNQDFIRLIPILNQFPIEEIILHPRTGMQRYEGIPDIQAFQNCLSVSKHPVVYNGDIRSMEDYQRLSEQLPGIRRWMIGRWSLVDPFLPMAIKTGKDEIQDKTGKMKVFHDDLFEQYHRSLNGSRHVLDRMKGLWRYFSLPFRDCKHAVKRIKQTRNPDQYRKVADHFFQTEAEWVGQTEKTWRT